MSLEYMGMITDYIFWVAELQLKSGLYIQRLVFERIFALYASKGAECKQFLKIQH